MKEHVLHFIDGLVQKAHLYPHKGKFTVIAVYWVRAARWTKTVTTGDRGLKSLVAVDPLYV